MILFAKYGSYVSLYCALCFLSRLTRLLRRGPHLPYSTSTTLTRAWPCCCDLFILPTSESLLLDTKPAIQPRPFALKIEYRCNLDTILAVLLASSDIGAECQNGIGFSQSNPGRERRSI
jgi:hypothetical protein